MTLAHIQFFKPDIPLVFFQSSLSSWSPNSHFTSKTIRLEISSATVLHYLSHGLLSALVILRSIICSAYTVVGL